MKHLVDLITFILGILGIIIYLFTGLTVFFILGFMLCLMFAIDSIIFSINKFKIYNNSKPINKVE